MAPLIFDPHQVARDDLRPLAVAFHDHTGRALDIDPRLGVAQVGLAGSNRCRSGCR